MFSIAPGLTGTDGVVAGNYIVTGTIGICLPAYVTRAVRCYGDTVNRSMFIDLEELYVDMSTPIHRG
jgi:hypothetical protein